MELRLLHTADARSLCPKSTNLHFHFIIEFHPYICTHDGGNDFPCQVSEPCLVFRIPYLSSHCMRIQIRLLVGALSMIGLGSLASLPSVRAQAPNSPKDPFNVVKNIDRLTAETPVPWGIIVGGQAVVLTAGGSTPIGVSADVYYDTWELGFHMEPYGDMIRATIRPMGRDAHGGLYVEYGFGSHSIRSINEHYNSQIEQYITDTITTDYSLMLLGGGYEYVGGYSGKGTTMGFLAGLSFGEWATSPTSSKGGGYVKFTTGVGVRIPISTMALTVGVNFIAWDGSDLGGGSGLALALRYAFNYNN